MKIAREHGNEVLRASSLLSLSEKVSDSESGHCRGVGVGSEICNDCNGRGAFKL